MAIDKETIKKLREKTGAGIMDCKEALLEAGGNEGKAVEFLRKKGITLASKKSSRATQEGTVASYIHPGGKIGVLLEVNCETDFAARNTEFQNFVKDMTMQIAAASPTYIRREDVPEKIIEKEKEILCAQVKDKPKDITEKIVAGRLNKFYKENCLLEQLFIKDEKKNVGDYLAEVVGKVKENIVIRRFTRFKLGEEI